METQQKETLERTAEDYPPFFFHGIHKRMASCSAGIVLLTEREERMRDSKMDLCNVLEKMAATGMFHCENVWGV